MPPCLVVLWFTPSFSISTLPSRQRRHSTRDSPRGSNCHCGSDLSPVKKAKQTCYCVSHISINNVTREGNKTAFVVSLAVIGINQFTLFLFPLGRSRWVRRSLTLLSLAAWQPRHFVPRYYSVLRSLWWAWGWLRWTNASQHADSSSTLSWHSAAPDLSLLSLHRSRRSPLIVDHTGRERSRSDPDQRVKLVPSAAEWNIIYLEVASSIHTIYFRKSTDWNKYPNNSKCVEVKNKNVFCLY